MRASLQNFATLFRTMVKNKIVNHVLEFDPSKLLKSTSNLIHIKGEKNGEND